MKGKDNESAVGRNSVCSRSNKLTRTQYAFE